MSDRDNAAEEVRAVATKITNIEQALENQKIIDQAERQRLKDEIVGELNSMLDVIDISDGRDSLEQVADSMAILESRMNILEEQRWDTPGESGEHRQHTHLIWVSSVDGEATSTAYAALNNTLTDSDLARFEEQSSLPAFDSRGDPHITIPATTTLLNATALTALVGRIPVRGQLQDPWRFKVIVGAENLASNGHRIPQLAGMLLAGTARGDLSLSCVSGNIDTATFIFRDGTIQTARRQSSPETSFTGLGWISDQFGNPCIAGELKSNALQYLTQATLINTGKAAAEAIANAQTETTTQPGSTETSTSVVGNIDDFVAGYATKESLSTVAEWLNDRQLNSFDAIYVPAGQTLAIHIEESIQIDRDDRARKVQNFDGGNSYVHTYPGGTD